MATFKINGRRSRPRAPDDAPLLWVIRDEIGLKGTKFGCGVPSAAPAPCMSTARPCGPV